MSGVYSGKFSQRQCKIQLSRENLGEQNVLESAFFRVFLKSKISATGATSGYAGFITNLQFWATRRLERILVFREILWNTVYLFLKNIFFLLKRGLHCQIYSTFFNSYSPNTQNINVTTLKINVIIWKHTVFFWLFFFLTHVILTSSQKNCTGASVDQTTCQR